MGEVARLQTQQISLPPQVRPGLVGTLCPAALDPLHAGCMCSAGAGRVAFRLVAHGLEEVAAQQDWFAAPPSIPGTTGLLPHPASLPACLPACRSRRGRPASPSLASRLGQCWANHFQQYCGSRATWTDGLAL